jgi:hypothetical protein
MKRYMTLGFAIVLALSLAMPAIGFRSNPIAQTAVSLKKVQKKAKKANKAARAARATAEAAQSAANQAQSTANGASAAAAGAQSSANAAQSSANAAQATANQALAETSDVSFNDLNASIEFTSSPNNSDSPKTVTLGCPAGKRAISANGTPHAQALVVNTNLEYGGTSWYLGPRAIAFEDTAIAGNWTLDMSGICVRSTG